MGRGRRRARSIFYYTFDNHVWHRLVEPSGYLSNSYIQTHAMEIIEVWPDGYGRPVFGKGSVKQELTLIALKTEL